MKNTRIVVLALVSILAFAPAAQAFDLAAVGVLNFTRNSIDPDPPTTEEGGKMGIGIGALAEFEWFPMTSIQFGMLWVTRTSTIQGTGTNLELTSKWLQIPVMVRVSPIDLVSVGGGMYFATGQGDINSKNVTTGAEASVTYEASDVSKSDIGLVFGGGLKLPLAPTLSLLADARLLLGLKDMHTTDVATAKTRDFQLLVGLNFGL